MPGASLVTLSNYAFLGWSDAIADRTDEIGVAMLDFLVRTNAPPRQRVSLPLPRRARLPASRTVSAVLDRPWYYFPCFSLLPNGNP